MSDSTLWVRLSDESVPLDAVDEKTLAKLEPLWKKALAQVGFASAVKERFFKRIGDTAYLNLSGLISTLSDQTLKLVPEKESFRVVSSVGGLRAVTRMIKIQWRLEKFLSSLDASSKLSDLTDKRVHSLALGICQQALLLRLSAPDSETLARWLMKPQSAPSGKRRTLKLLLQLQKERNAIASAWGDFGRKPDSEARPSGPELIWENAKMEALPEDARAETPAALSTQTEWQGLPVSPGEIQGEFWIAPDRLDGAIEPPSSAAIFVFHRARPEAVELYPRARAVLFIEGGVLSHACSVAREQSIPCITALGRGFLSALRGANQKKLLLDCAQGKATMVL